jgi:RimK family alpha-L-glutamate ligase
MTSTRLLALGPSVGWHAHELRSAAKTLNADLVYADYESLTAEIATAGKHHARCSAGDLRSFDAVICRTMPNGSMEQVIFRLAILKAAEANGVKIVNPPRTLEAAIDKYETLTLVGSLGFPVPETIVTQSRTEAIRAFELLGEDVVVKPIFGGEGRGVMRVRDRQLAWTTFSTLQQLNSILYVQRFVLPGGRDLRLLVLGDEVIGIRRIADHDFRTNVAGGALCQPTSLSSDQIDLAKQISAHLRLRIGSIDLIDNAEGPPLVLEVNGVPGWKGAQQCVPFKIAEKMVAAVLA